MLAAGVAVGGYQSHTTTATTSYSGPGSYSSGPTAPVQSSGPDVALLIAVSVPLILSLLPLLWNQRPGSRAILAACAVMLTAFVVISAASVGLLFFPSALLMLLALRRSILIGKTQPGRPLHG